MPRKDGRIEPGQRLTSAISARAWNRAQDAADIVLGTTPGLSAEPGRFTTSPYTWVYAKNISGVCSRWAVLKVSGMAVTPTAIDTNSATVQFQSMPVLEVQPAEVGEEHACVAIEPIAANAIGKVAIAGAVQVKKADIDKIANKTVLWEDDNWALVVLGGSRLRIGRISAAWEKGITAEVEEVDEYGEPLDPQVTFNAKNYFANLTLSGSYMTVVCGLVRGQWSLLAFDWHSLGDYDMAKQQLLSHDAEGFLRWVDTTGCDSGGGI